MELEEFKKDYCWRSAFNEAFGKDFQGYGDPGPNPIDDVMEIIACEEGENEEKDWIGIFKMRDGKFLVLQAGCDATGWDCQAGGSYVAYDTLEEALSPLSLTQEFRERLYWQLRIFLREAITDEPTL